MSPFSCYLIFSLLLFISKLIKKLVCEYAIQFHSSFLYLFDPIPCLLLSLFNRLGGEIYIPEN